MRRLFFILGLLSLMLAPIGEPLSHAPVGSQATLADHDTGHVHGHDAGSHEHQSQAILPTQTGDDPDLRPDHIRPVPHALSDHLPESPQPPPRMVQA